MWSNEDFEDDPLEEPLDNSCFLAVDFASNIVAKGTILEDTCEEELIEVMLEISIQGEALLPIPLEEEFIETVKDAIGHILSWPRHLVIRCSDLEKVVAKPKRKPVVAGEEMRKENVVKKRMTRGQSKQRVRMVLMIAAAVVDGQLDENASIKLLCELDLFGYESFTYIDWEDFEAVFTLDEATSSVITTYMMSLYKKMLDEPQRGSGICFVHPCAISPSYRKTTPKHIEDASRQVVDRLFKRNGRDIIMLAYNPGRHWVLGVLDMKKDTCFYLDSLRHSSIDEQLRKIIDMAMAMYAARSGAGKRVKLKWVNARCPKQPGSTECGYCVMKFMKEIVCKGVEILYNDNVAGRVEEYTDADLDNIREDWSNYVTTFI